MTTIKELKTECFAALGEETAKEQARAIASELSTDKQQYKLSHKIVWESLHGQLQDKEPVTLAQVCATLASEENPFLAMLLVSVWLFSQWLSLLLWLAPRAIALGRATRQGTIAIANGYTKVSYRLTHSSEFPSELPETPMVEAVVEQLFAEVLPSIRQAIADEAIACSVVARDFYLVSAVRLLHLLQKRWSADQPLLLSAA
ncbi:hypothetical protein S7335_1105 [Synechococcus sp. PCC 7335]|uniref:hypothetical protein n=1 Tax=Synechococcus sp. (strain ATCC 29403 / PCC 7335) TaxID=91464 RepID=UPI00017EC820|nr:hypothetical protein [Synechococcus sp. PCC 7335]EDX82802.1 hypothetical protein S7335_1105 [Synechococcus sp. PCC 7335]